MFQILQVYLFPNSPIQFDLLIEDPNTNSDTNSDKNSIIPVVKRSVYQTSKRQAGGEFENEYLTRHFHKKKRSGDGYMFYYLRRFTDNNLLHLLRNRHTLNNDLTRNRRRTSDDYLTRNGRSANEYLTRNGRASDEYLFRNGRASDDYLTRNGRASDEYLFRNGRASDEYLTRSGRASAVEYLTRNGRSPDTYVLTRNGRPCCHFSKNIDRKFQSIEK